MSMKSPARLPLAMAVVLSTVALFAMNLTGCSESDNPPVSSHATPPHAQTDAKPYPLETCVVSGDKLGSMGDPYEVEIQGQTVKLCCAGCESALREEPARYLSILNAAQAKGTPSPTSTSDKNSH